ncbi:nitro/flavin reductase [gut metagenome]|uniref:Nitro/flavin reductase n=1 Tax=gut metagenome TaxID=749906 RepID=J9FPB0_9ZZZZ
MENTYHALRTSIKRIWSTYDEIVHQYYDLRDTTKPVDTFTAQMAERIGSTTTASPSMLEILQKQGFLKK